MISGMDSETELDRALVRSFVRHGDEAAFRQLYRRHAPSLYLLARRLLGASHSAEDATQDTWMRAADRLGSFRWESSLRTWLCGITVNRCREMMRGVHGSTGPGQLDMVPEPGAGAPETPDVRVDLERAIAALPDGSRGVLVLHDIEGRTHVEIAAMLGIDEGTSRSQLFKARRALRELLARVPPDLKGVRDGS